MKRIDRLEKTGNHLIKLIGTYEVVVWRLLIFYLAVRHIFGR
jgi:hypothetical protein